MNKYSEMNNEEKALDLQWTYEYAFTYMMYNLADYTTIDDESEVRDHIESQVNIFIENDPMFFDDENKEKYDDIERYKADLVDFLMEKYEELYTEKED